MFADPCCIKSFVELQQHMEGSGTDEQLAACLTCITIQSTCCMRHYCAIPLSTLCGYVSWLLSSFISLLCTHTHPHSHTIQRLKPDKYLLRTTASVKHQDGMCNAGLWCFGSVCVFVCGCVDVLWRPDQRCWVKLLYCFTELLSHNTHTHTVVPVSSLRISRMVFTPHRCLFTRTNHGFVGVWPDRLQTEWTE